VTNNQAHDLGDNSSLSASDDAAAPGPSQDQIRAYLASPAAQATYRNLPDDWRCPACDRNKYDVVRYDSGGWLYARIVVHHDHLTDNDPEARARFDPIGVCSDCNDIDARVKGRNPQLRYDWSLPPLVIKRFIRIRPHRTHEIDHRSVELFARSMIEVHNPSMMASHPQYREIKIGPKMIAVTWSEALTRACTPIICEMVFEASSDLYTLPTRQVPPQFIGRRSSWEREGRRWLVPWSELAEKELSLLSVAFANSARRLQNLADLASTPGVMER